MPVRSGPEDRSCSLRESEGRNAAFLAGPGLRLVALDQSAAGLKETQMLADKAAQQSTSCNLILRITALSRTAAMPLFLSGAICRPLCGRVCRGKWCRA